LRVDESRTVSDTGQASAEWTGLVLLVALMFTAFLATAARVPALELAQAISGRIECAIALSDACAEEPEIAAAYGPEVAGQVTADAPEIRYESRMTALPVDFRSCRDGTCGNGPSSGAVSESNTGQPAAAFVHVVDCRPAAIASSAAKGYDCDGDRAGNLYIQYWLYYEDSTTGDVPGGHHQDDWEGYQVRVGPGGTDARATSHHGYDCGGGAGNWLSDVGFVQSAAWCDSTGHDYVSGGSHAGHVHEDGEPRGARWTPASALELIPIETLDATARGTDFAISPPWEKGSYRDPED
jgi:hypothetical protein